MNELLYKLDLWKKKHLEAKGLTVNMGKTKIMICSKHLHSLKDSGKYHCDVCPKGVGSNSIFCDGFQTWIHTVVLKVDLKLFPSIYSKDIPSFANR